MHINLFIPDHMCKYGYTVHLAFLFSTRKGLGSILTLTLLILRFCDFPQFLVLSLQTNARTVPRYATVTPSHILSYS
jgi:hypothetical protein